MPSRTNVVGGLTYNSIPPTTPFVGVFNQSQPSNSNSLRNYSQIVPSHLKNPTSYSLHMLPSSPIVTNQPSSSSLAPVHSIQVTRGTTLASEPSITEGKYHDTPLETFTLIRYENVRLGLRGGSPMWPLGSGNNREPWSTGQKHREESTSDITRKQVVRGRGPSHLDKNASASNMDVPSGGKADDTATARAKVVGSLVAADYNDFDDENSQLTPPDLKEMPAKLAVAKSDCRIPALDVEISSELELLAESENIVIIDHMTEDSIVTGSEVIEECIVSSTNMDLIDDKEKIEQVVEEDEQHVVMMIEENTLTASFSVEQRDKQMSKTFVRKLKHVKDSESVCSPGVGGNNASTCTTSFLNDSIVVKTSSTSDVKSNSDSNNDVKNRFGSVDVKPLASAVQSSLLTVCVDEQVSRNDILTTVESENAINLVQVRTSRERTDRAKNNVVKADVMLGSNLFEKKCAVVVIESIPGNNENINIVQNESTVLDLSTTLQDNLKVTEKCQGIVHQRENKEHKNRQLLMPQKIIKTNPSLPLVVNKKLHGVGQMLLVADSPESPDQQEMNVDPSPESSFHEFESLFNKMGQGTENVTVTTAKREEITPSNLPKDISVSARAKESIFALLKGDHDSLNLPGVEAKHSADSNILKSSISNLEISSPNSNPKANVKAPCSPLTPPLANPTKSKSSTNINTLATKPTLSEQQNFIVSRGAISISRLDSSASPSVTIQPTSKSAGGKPDTGVGLSDVVSIQKRRRSEQFSDKEKTTPSPPPTSVVTTNVPVYLADQYVPTGAVKVSPLPTSLVCSALSTVTISVITSTPRDVSSARTASPIDTQPSSVTNKNTPAMKSKYEFASTTQSLQTTAVSSVPPSSPCALPVVSTAETYVPLTGIASSAQVTQLLNLPARSLQTLIENNQLFKSSPSNSQGRNVLVSSTQCLSEPILSPHESVGTKSLHATAPVEIHAATKPSETREFESQPHNLAQYQSRNSETTLHLGEQTKMVSSFDDTPKFMNQSKLTMQQNNPYNVNKTASQVHPQIVSVLESRLMSSSQYNDQQTPVTTPTSAGNVGSFQPDNTSIRTIPPHTLYSRQVPSTAATTGVMANSTTNMFTSNQPLYSMSKANTNTSYQQHSPLTTTLKVKEEKLDDSSTSGCAPSQAALCDIINQGGCKTSPSNRLEESQNVLLKQLLQNTGCAQTQSTILVPSLEAQLAQPVPSTPSALLSPLLLDTGPPASQPQFKSSGTPPDGSRACLPVSRTPSREDLPSPLPSPKRETPQANVPLRVSPQKETPPPSLPSPKREAPPLLLSPKREVSLPQASPRREPSPKREPPTTLLSPKREVPPPQPSPNKEMQLGLVEIKKEVIEEPERKPDLGHIPDQSPSDIKKMKRRQYQQKRRQSQGKEAAGGPAKKRQKKVTTVEEDWDTYMENLMQNLQQLPSIHVQEPSLPSNPIVGNIFGAGDLAKLSDSAASRFGELHGSYGNANLFQVSDYYDSKPFGPCIPLPPPPPISTQRGFYDQEFAPLKFGNNNNSESDDRRVEAPGRDLDSPRSVISSSSPECAFPETPVMFPGLRLIRPDSDEEEERGGGSPVMPLLAPIPVRPPPPTADAEDKENKGAEQQARSRSTVPLRDAGNNVAVTLTLSSAAADDIVGVLRDLANFLRIPPPSGYQIVERTDTPPSQKLGLYRCKGRDGKEGAPVDIQSILNGEAKFCRHCDVVVLNNSVKKKVSDLPFLAREDIPDNEDYLNFCSTSCYMQFALMHRLPSVTQDKAAATVDHLCQTEVAAKVVEIFPKEDASKSTEVTSIPSEPERLSVEEVTSALKKPKSVCFKTWSPGALQPTKKMKKTTDREMTELLFRMGITVMPPKMPEDTRSCIFCHHVGDGIADGPARLLNYDVDRWVHLNCALWSDDVYETVNGALMNLDNALKQSLSTGCVSCRKDGASIRCFKLRCSNVYHLGCAVKSECVFFKNKAVYCAAHVPKNERDNELTTLAVFRRVYVDRDENRQVASVMHRSDHNHLMRVGSLIFLNVGQLLPHQLQAFHTCNCIYPIGYKIVRFYWSMRVHNKRCRYVCSIHDVAGRPEFRVLVQEPDQDDLELRDSSPKAVWARILEPMAAMRKEMGGIQVFPRFVSGEDLFGLTEPAIVRVLESLPGVESMSDYRFKYGRNPLLELPLAVNPTGSARSEPKLRIAYPWKRPHTQRTATSSRPVFVPTATVAGEAACPYSKQFVHSKSSQYKKMKQDWRNNVYLARSKIQGLGLYAARDLERHTMVIEYIGEVIRTELSELREKLYEARNRGIYMFRLDEERVVDATLSGGLARYINHSCNPNCVAEIVEVDRDLRIIIFAKKRISRGEELAYDYKFDIEDDQHKIPCNCGAANCKKWMN